MLFVYLLVLVLFLIGFHISIRYSKHGRFMNRLPGPPALPIFGNTLKAFNISPEESWLLVRRFFKEYYPILRVWKIMSASVFMCHADDVKTILSCKKNINKPHEYQLIKRGIGNGLIVSGGSLWHHRRKIINQAITPELLKYYSESLVIHSEKFVAEHRSSKDVVLNIPPIFLSLSLRVSVEGILGLDLSKFKSDEIDEYRERFSEFSNIVTYRAFRPYIKNWMMPFLPVGHREAESIKVLKKLTNKIVEERKAYHENWVDNSLKNADDDVKDKKKCLFVTDVLMKAEKDGLIDRNGTLDEISNLLIANFFSNKTPNTFYICPKSLETTGSQMCYVLALLAENKKAQDLLRAEILEVLGDGEDKITINNVKRMEYLDRCIKESMRLLPTVPLISRDITDDIKLKDYTIPSGTDLHISIWDLHRDPNFWSDPDTFDPDRFLPENVQSRHRFSYAPFSAGLRSCIGQKLAMMQMKILTANIIHNFILEPVDFIANMKIQFKITLTHDRIRLKFIRINR